MPTDHLCFSFSAGLIVFLSMMVGAFLWGGLADKVGRRRCLIVALAINCVFAFLSSFAQGYGFFLFFRLMSGIGYSSLLFGINCKSQLYTVNSSEFMYIILFGFPHKLRITVHFEMHWITTQPLLRLHLKKDSHHTEQV